MQSVFYFDSHKECKGKINTSQSAEQSFKDLSILFLTITYYPREKVNLPLGKYATDPAFNIIVINIWGYLKTQNLTGCFVTGFSIFPCIN